MSLVVSLPIECSDMDGVDDQNVNARVQLENKGLPFLVVY